MPGRPPTDKFIRQSQALEAEKSLKKPDERLSALVSEGAFEALAGLTERFGTTWTTEVFAGHLFAKPDIPANAPAHVWEGGWWDLHPDRKGSRLMKWGDEVWWDVGKQCPMVFRTGRDD
jgi:hypothetical protein